MTERLTQATAGAADLVSLPPEATFEEVCYQAFGRARIELGEGEVKKMYAVLRKTGYLRYEVNVREGIDVEFDPASSKPFRFAVARLAR
jgi:hypothetical protein